jgi:hypothetical protein
MGELLEKEWVCGIVTEAVTECICDVFVYVSDPLAQCLSTFMGWMKPRQSSKLVVSR